MGRGCRGKLLNYPAFDWDTRLFDVTETNR